MFWGWIGKIKALMTVAWWSAVLLVLLMSATTVVGATRVALMDFSTEDNSYKSIEAAAQFFEFDASKKADFKWVEPSQIHVVKSELALGEITAAQTNRTLPTNGGGRCRSPALIEPCF